MKKLLIVLVAALTIAACGNKTKGGEAVDSTRVDSLMTDSVVLGLGDLWSIEAVEAQIRVCFDEVNRMSADGGIDIWTRCSVLRISWNFRADSMQRFMRVR